MRALAIVAAWNEERFIAGCFDHLLAQGLEVYLLDNDSTDRTVAIAEGYLGRGLRGIERLPRDGTFRWRRILERKQELAAELDADWYLHLDPDEAPLPRRGAATLAAALAEVDAAGFNAVDFDEFTFVPTRESPDHDHPDFRRTMRWYYPFAPKRPHRLIAWKRQPAPVELAASGGHVVAFPDRRIWPRRFGLRHYLFLSREHAVRKYGMRRYDAAELRSGWHDWRSSLRAEAVRLPREAELRVADADAELDPSEPRAEHCIQWPDR